MGDHEANHHFFVDESGDAVLFNAKGDVIIGQGDGSLRCPICKQLLNGKDAPLVFMVGAVHQRSTTPTTRSRSKK